MTMQLTGNRSQIAYNLCNALAKGGLTHLKDVLTHFHTIPRLMH